MGAYHSSISACLVIVEELNAGIRIGFGGGGYAIVVDLLTCLAIVEELDVGALTEIGFGGL